MGQHGMNIKGKPAEVTEQVLAETQAAAGRAFDKANEGIKQSTAAAHNAIGQTQTHLKEGVDRAMKTAEQWVGFAQGNWEAVVKSSQIWGAGIGEIGKRFAAHAQNSMDEAVNTAKALAGVKTVKEAVDIHTSYVRAATEKAVSETSQITEHSLRLAEQAAAPITARVNAAMETFTARV